MIIDECPAAESLSGGYNCDTCTTSETNDLGQTWNFDIAVDAMSTSQVRRSSSYSSPDSSKLDVNLLDII